MDAGKQREASVEGGVPAAADDGASMGGASGGGGAFGGDANASAGGVPQATDGASASGGGGAGGFVQSPDGAAGGLQGCNGAELSFTVESDNVLIVLDTSGSMGDVLSGFAVSKWDAVREALATVLNEVAPDIFVGLDVYPSSGDPQQPIPVACTTDCCRMPNLAAVAVGIDSGVATVPQILSVLAGITPAGGTPTAEALARADHYFVFGDGSFLDGNDVVVLVTDGGPNCNEALTCGPADCTTNIEGQCPVSNCCISEPRACLDDARTLSEVQVLAASGVRTAVVGLPGSERYADVLNALATAGGLPNPSGPPSHYAVQPSATRAELTSVFRSVLTARLSACEIRLDDTPPDLNLVNVTVDGQIVPRGANGWLYGGATSASTIALQGATCDRALVSGIRSVAVLYGCGTVTEP